MQGEGSGWHHESRRHSEAASKGKQRPTHAPRSGKPDTSKVRSKIEERIATLERGQATVKEALQHFPGGDLEELDFDDQYKDRDYGEWTDLDGQMTGELKVLRGLKSGSVTDASLDEKIKANKAEYRKISRAADKDQSLEDMAYHSNQTQENAGEAGGLWFVKALLKGA